MMLATFLSLFVAGGTGLGTVEAGAKDVKAATSIDELKGFEDKLKWLQKNAVSGGSYVIEINKQEVFSVLNPFSYAGDLSYKKRKILP
jgi:hypothetical protein